MNVSVKASFRYMGQSLLTSIIWFYGVLFVLQLFFTVVFAATGGNVNSSGLEMASAVFLLVIGMNMFTENFGMMLQNGVSRKTFFVTRLLVFACMSVFIAGIDRILQPLMALMPGNALFGSKSFFEFLYPLQGVGGVLMNFLLCAFLNFFVLNLGAFIATMFYRLPKWGKPVVGAGAPILLVMVLPAIDYSFFNGGIFNAIGQFTVLCFGLSTSPVQPLFGMLTFLVLAAVFTVLSWLLTRRATFSR